MCKAFEKGGSTPMPRGSCTTACMGPMRMLKATGGRLPPRFGTVPAALGSRALHVCTGVLTLIAIRAPVLDARSAPAAGMHAAAQPLAQRTATATQPAWTPAAMPCSVSAAPAALSEAQRLAQLLPRRPPGRAAPGRGARRAWLIWLMFACSCFECN